MACHGVRGQRLQPGAADQVDPRIHLAQQPETRGGCANSPTFSRVDSRIHLASPVQKRDEFGNTPHHSAPPPRWIREFIREIGCESGHPSRGTPGWAATHRLVRATPIPPDRRSRDKSRKTSREDNGNPSQFELTPLGNASSPGDRRPDTSRQSGKRVSSGKTARGPERHWSSNSGSALLLGRSSRQQRRPGAVVGAQCQELKSAWRKKALVATGDSMLTSVRALLAGPDATCQDSGPGGCEQCMDAGRQARGRVRSPRTPRLRGLRPGRQPGSGGFLAAAG
jgi:hypothetical protein